MSIKIRTLRNTKVIAKKLIKELKILLSTKPTARIGMIWDDSLAPIYETVLKSKRIKWQNVKLFSLVEYKNDQTINFENNLFSEFINKLNLDRENYDSLKERIDEYKEVDNLKDLYKFYEGIDLILFPIDKRGNFLFNDFESKISFINIGNNGNEIISPGIKSIMYAKKVIAFAIQDGMDDIVSLLNTRVVSSDEFVSLLNIHPNFTLFTLYSIFPKKKINKKGLLVDNDNVAGKVLDPSYEGDIDGITETSSNEQISELSVSSPYDNDEEDDDNEDIDLSDKDVEIEQEEIKTDDEDDGLAIAEPTNNNKNNLDDEVEKVINSNDEDENNKDDDDEKESLFKSFKDEYDKQLKELQAYQENEKEKDEIDINEERILEDKFVDETNENEIESNEKINLDYESVNETIIDNREIESALFETNEYDEKISEKIKEMDKLKNQELYIPECEGEIDKDIQTLEVVRDLLQKELDQLENKKRKSESDFINEIDDQSLNDLYDVEDSVSLEANKYAPKGKTIVISEEEFNESNNINAINDDVENYNNDFNVEININDVLINDAFEVVNEDNIISNTFDNSLPRKQEINFAPLNFKRTNIEGKTREEIEKIIQIKEDTLKLIELLIVNNKLASQSVSIKKNNNYPLEKKNNLNKKNNNKKATKNKKREFINDSEKQKIDHNFVKIKYVPGNRPVPMLAVYHEANNDWYDSCVKEMKTNYGSSMFTKKFNNINEHVSNLSAYISYNVQTNEIDLLAFSSFSHLLYLMRYINKPIFFFLSKDNFNLIAHEFVSELSTEFIISKD